MAAGRADPLLLCAVVGTQAAVDRRPEKKELTAANPFDRLPPSVRRRVQRFHADGRPARRGDRLPVDQFIKAERERRFVEVNAILR